MPSHSTRITTTYAKLPPNIREICETIRAIIHKAVPSIEENWKWGPAFEYNGLAFGLWGFKNHVTLVFYRGAEMSDKHKLFNDGLNNARNRMIKFASLKEVNAKKLSDYFKEAVKLNDSAKPKMAERKAEIPAELAKWFANNKKAKAFYDNLSYTHKKEITVHLTSAKQEETRKRRFKQVTDALKKEEKTFR